MPNKASPENALIFYSPCVPDQPIPHVNNITRRGCSGQLMLEKTKEYSDLFQLLGFCNESNTSFQETIVKRFNGMPIEIVSSEDDISPPKSGVKVVDFTEKENAWEIINAACALDKPDTLICIVSQTTKNDNSNTEFMPQQSYWMKEGVRVKGIEDKRSLIYSNFHFGSTRTDSVEQFGLDIETLGGNKKILAWHFLAEIGNKLGFVEKYGA